MTNATAKLPDDSVSLHANTKRHLKLAAKKASSTPSAPTLEELCQLYPGLKLLDADSFSFVSYDLWLDHVGSR
ncbi:MAG: hypothetical protein GX589_01095 [Deltaproteobacteria bacterium]|nr:hypothetical protein [Deltaproteobacteria bacterium]